MGQFVSVITKGINAVADDIASLVTDVTTTGAQLVALAKEFTPRVLHDLLQLEADAGLPGNVINAMTACQTAVVTFYEKKFGSDPGSQVDNGCVANYNANGKLDTVTDQINQDFSNWGLITDSKIMDAMAKTLMAQVKSKEGKSGVSYGTYRINSNEAINWAVGYGLFTIAAGNQGLVYAFCAEMIGGWKKQS